MAAEPTFEERIEALEAEVEALRSGKLSRKDLLALMRSRPHDPVETLLPGSVKDELLASPNSGARKVLFEAHGYLGLDIGASTRLLGSTNSTNSVMVASGGGVNMAGEAKAPAIFRFAAADYDIPELTERMALQAAFATNSTTPGITITFELRSLSSASGAADFINYTAGSVVTGSQVSFVGPAADSTGSSITDNFTIPANGRYLMAVTTSATLANNAVIGCHAQLLLRSS